MIDFYSILIDSQKDTVSRPIAYRKLSNTSSILTNSQEAPGGIPANAGFYEISLQY
jgi:hypothetical protein